MSDDSPVDDYADAIPEGARGRRYAAVLARRETAPHIQRALGRGTFAAVGFALLGVLLIATLSGWTGSPSTSDFGAWLFAIASFIPITVMIAVWSSRPRRASLFELRENGVLVSPNVFILWEEIASVNFEGRLPDGGVPEVPERPFTVRVADSVRFSHDMALGFVLRDFDAVIQRGPHDETISIVDPYGDTPGQAVVNLDRRVDETQYLRLLQITRSVLAARGIPFRRESSASRRLEQREYRVGRAE